MSLPALVYDQRPAMSRSTLLLALTGWMDGGHVSTGTVKHIMTGRTLTRVAAVNPAGFYIDSFPGSMDVAALFRPHVKYERGLVTKFDWAASQCSADPAANIAFFVGKEPNLNWAGFGDCIFDLCKTLDVARIIFMGSFGGRVPHTRQPRLYGSVSSEKLLPLLKTHGLRVSDYDGPGSFATHLLVECPKRGIDMLSIVAEIPGYLDGANPFSIEAVASRLGRILGLPVDLAKLRQQSTKWELQVSEAVEKDDDLAKTVRKMEEDYDNELIGVGQAGEDEDDGE